MKTTGPYNQRRLLNGLFVCIVFSVPYIVFGMSAIAEDRMPIVTIENMVDIEEGRACILPPSDNKHTKSLGRPGVNPQKGKLGELYATDLPVGYSLRIIDPTVFAVCKVRLSSPPSNSVSVLVATRNGSAHAEKDFSTINTWISICRDRVSCVQHSLENGIKIPVITDKMVMEETEDFVVQLVRVNGAVIDTEANRCVVRIHQPPVPTCDN